MKAKAEIPKSFRSALSIAQKKDSSPFAIPEKKIIVHDVLAERKALDYPWGIPESTLIALEWTGSVGTSNPPLTYSVLECETERMYIEHGVDGIALLTTTNNHQDPRRLDLLFLQQLFASNGEEFHTCIIGSPPQRIYTPGIDSFDFLVDIVYSAFDEADAWEQLMEEFPGVWNDEYERPEVPVFANDSARSRYESDWRDPVNKHRMLLRYLADIAG
jgi:hypothetical protein